MKPDIKEKWLTALRSGKYRQGRGTLRTVDDNYCCLGVLCDLFDPDGWALTPKPLTDGSTVDIWTHDGVVGTLHDKVRVWAGLRTTNPKVRISDGTWYDYPTLAELNDDPSMRYTFAAIADLIEARL